MHRLSFSIDELRKLKHLINEIDDIRSYSPKDIDDARTVAKHITSFCTVDWFSYDHLYDVIKEQVSQIIFQSIFHYPLTSIIRMMNHKNPIIKLIVQWRIEIAR